MAHTKAGGSTSLGRDSASKRLGIKRPDGVFILAGSIVVRQRGTRIHPGKNVARASDDTLFARAPGIVRFTTKKRRRFDGSLQSTRYVHVIPSENKKAA